MASLQLKLISGGAPDQNPSFDFSEHGGTIGRSKDCDWTLEDVDRYISNKHILITFINNTFILTDISSNGVFINNSQVPLGKGNTSVLARGDQVILGKFCMEVVALELQSSVPLPEAIPAVAHNAGRPDSGDLLDLIKRPDRSFVPSEPDAQAADNLGLFAILSGNVQSPPAQNFDYKSPNKTTESAPSLNSQAFTCNLTQEASGNKKQSIQRPAQTATSSKNTLSSTIPDDWNFDDSYIAQSSHSPLPEPEIPLTVPQVDQAKNVKSAKKAPAYKEPENAAQPMQPNPRDNFFELLYKKLGLPKEQIDSIDHTQFANDVVDILTTSTQGLMALLAGRSVFKQESRLSMTMIRPQSNNPLKFALDPSDTLEMLLVKKKPGYMSAQDAYLEAMNDAQLHQMAFLSGLQATLSGLLDELSPVVIEQATSKNEKGFLGLKVSAQKWQVFVEKQETLHKQVSENLNDILSRHFSSAYEKHIDEANNKK